MSRRGNETERGRHHTSRSSYIGVGQQASRHTAHRTPQRQHSSTARTGSSSYQARSHDWLSSSSGSDGSRSAHTHILTSPPKRGCEASRHHPALACSKEQHSTQPLPSHWPHSLTPPQRPDRIPPHPSLVTAFDVLHSVPPAFSPVDLVPASQHFKRTSPESYTLSLLPAATTALRSFDWRHVDCARLLRSFLLGNWPPRLVLVGLCLSSSGTCPP